MPLRIYTLTHTVGDYKRKTCLSCHDSALLNRLHIGYVHLRHYFLLSGDDLSECGTCECPLTVKHIQMECVDFSDETSSVAFFIKDSFGNVEVQKIADFIEETRFYKQL